MKINLETYKARADRVAFRNCDENGEIFPSEADQSGAEDTDINVIVKRYGVYGTIPQGSKIPRYGEDLSEIPTDLRDMIHTARTLETLRGQLPDALKSINIEDLITMDPKAISDILNPPAKKSEEKGEQK